MKLLTMVNNEISIDTHAIGIKEFKNIWESDTSATKNQAKQELTFVYLFAYWDTIYKNYNEKERLEVLRKDVLDDQEVPQRVLDAIIKYKDMQLIASPSIVFLDDHIEIMQSLREYYKRIDWTARDIKGALLYKPKEVTGAMKDAEIVIKKCKTLKEDVLREQEGGSTIRGGAEKGLFEDGF